MTCSIKLNRHKWPINKVDNLQRKNNNEEKLKWVSFSFIDISNFTIFKELEIKKNQNQNQNQKEEKRDLQSSYCLSCYVLVSCCFSHRPKSYYESIKPPNDQTSFHNNLVNTLTIQFYPFLLITCSSVLQKNWVVLFSF